MNGEMNNKRRAGCGKAGKRFALRHPRGAAADAREHDALRHFRNRQLALQSGGGGGESRHARGERVGNIPPVKAAQLLGQRREDRQIAGMQPRHVVSRRISGDKLGLDLIERQRRSVDDARILRAELHEIPRHDRAGIEADRATRDQLAPTHSDEVGCAGAGADEMYGHCAAPELASAQVAAPTTRRDAIRRDDGPAAASAAASASDGTPMSASTRSDRVVTRVPAALSSASGTNMMPTPNVDAAVAIPASASLAVLVAIAFSSAALTPARASAARIAASISAAAAPRLQPIPAKIMA